VFWYGDLTNRHDAASYGGAKAADWSDVIDISLGMETKQKFQPFVVA